MVRKPEIWRLRKERGDTRKVIITEKPKELSKIDNIRLETTATQMVTVRRKPAEQTLPDPRNEKRKLTEENRIAVHPNKKDLPIAITKRKSKIEITKRRKSPTTTTEPSTSTTESPTTSTTEPNTKEPNAVEIESTDTLSIDNLPDIL